MLNQHASYWQVSGCITVALGASPCFSSNAAHSPCTGSSLALCSSEPMGDAFISKINSQLTSQGMHASSGAAFTLQQGGSGALPKSMQDWEVHWGHIEMQRYIGRGAFGRVRLIAATLIEKFDPAGLRPKVYGSLLLLPLCRCMRPAGAT